MSQISAKDVKNLRDITGVGMMDCKKALDETGGDMQQAIDYLRKKGAALAAKRADREAREGMVGIKINPDHKSGVILELNCETDFVARGEVFTGFVSALAELALASRTSSPEALLVLTLGEGLYSSGCPAGCNHSCRDRSAGSCPGTGERSCHAGCSSSSDCC